jgi:tetratricopeptide (TPR) repeat protein
MRIIIFLWLIASISKPAFSQVPSQKEIQSKLLEAANELNAQIADTEKQIAEAKKNKADEETIKDLEDQLAMLKKQLAMMGGVNKQLGKVSAKTFQQASEEGNNIIPKKDVARINSVSKKILTDAELASFVKTVFTEVEKFIPAAEKNEAVKIYNNTKSEFKSPNALGSAASGCWMYGHQEKALWIIGKACIDNPANMDNLNNYAAFLSMMGAEQAAIPILLYLNNKFPNNNTILNNLGQAWFGLGDMTASKKYLEAATELYPSHSMANLTLSKIYLSGPTPDTTKAKDALKRSISESYCADKEHLLTGIGGALTLDDLPEFNYPVEKDPLGFERYFSIIPDQQKDLDDYEDAIARLKGFYNALDKESEKVGDEMKIATQKYEEYKNKLTNDKSFREKVLPTFNSPSHALAIRTLDLLAAEESANLTNNKSDLAYHFKKTQFPLSLLLTADFNSGQNPKKKRPMSLSAFFRQTTKIILVEWIEPLARLEKDRQHNISNSNLGNMDDKHRCENIDLFNKYFLSDAKTIKEAALNKIEKFWQEHVDLLNQYIGMYYFGTTVIEKQNRFADDLMYGRLIPESEFTTRRFYFEYLANYDGLVKQLEMRDYASKCDQITKEKPPVTTVMPSQKEPGCPYNKDISLANGGKMTFKCGRIENDETKLKNLKSGETKGSAITSDQHNPIYDQVEPLGLPHGPSIFSDKQSTDLEKFSTEEAPLVAGIEDDNTRTYIEYDKFGNLTDFRMKLNEEGTGLAVSNDIKTGLTSRWIWVATSSGREQKLAGLFKKQ